MARPVFKLFIIDIDTVEYRYLDMCVMNHIENNDNKVHNESCDNMRDDALQVESAPTKVPRN